MKPFLLFLCVAAASQTFAQTNPVFALWPAGAPGALGKADADSPTITMFQSAVSNRTGAAMVICPGGGYGRLAEHEGEHYARWLNELGVTAFVLKYRLGTDGYRHPAMLQDAARAIRTVRATAGEWNVNPARIGIMGSSAGGHLASTLLTHFDAGNPDASESIERHASRPDLVVLCYPVVTMLDPFTHKGSRQNLLGTNPPAALLRELSAELQVTTNSPPTFLWHTVEDRAVPVENSLRLAESLRKVGVPLDLHLYERGAHGMALGSREWNPARRHPWVRDCEFWLKQRGFVAE
jgi:acetyl esterase/lipase